MIERGRSRVPHAGRFEASYEIDPGAITPLSSAAGKGAVHTKHRQFVRAALAPSSIVVRKAARRTAPRPAAARHPGRNEGVGDAARDLRPEPSSGLLTAADDVHAVVSEAIDKLPPWRLDPQVECSSVCSQRPTRAHRESIRFGSCSVFIFLRATGKAPAGTLR